MDKHYGTLLTLTGNALTSQVKARALEDFAYSFGWVPSDILEEPALTSVANGHLIVEHGLETSAVISFLKTPFRELSSYERKTLFSLSYNNLIDWHIQVDSDAVNFVYNRTETPVVVDSYKLARDQYDALRSTAFEKITERKPNTNLPALDNALIKTISNWKRLLSAEMGRIIPNDLLSALFNAIIFARAAEDQYRFRGNGRETIDDSFDQGFQTLLNTWLRGDITSIRELILAVIGRFIPNIPDFVINEAGLSAFDNLNHYTVAELLKDFYRNKYASYYDYDFSIISKHALSRIYEGYVSVLRLENSPQGSFFPELPTEERDRAFGSVYTPQYIAKFFAKFIRQATTPSTFKNLKVCDPACGSGIFIRTFLEMQAEPVGGMFDQHTITESFKNALGVDIDPNATHATQLSLSLLHLVITGTLPDELNINTSEAIQYFSNNPKLHNTYDAIIANPPYVAIDSQSVGMQDTIVKYLGDYGKGRLDMYIPFLLMSINLLKPGGYGCFVLPHSFMLSKSAGPIRQLLATETTIQCIADLSAVRVFGDVGVYVVLLIFKKRSVIDSSEPLATVVKCQEFPGQALQDVLDDRIGENKFYSVYKVGQDIFGTSEWILLPPLEEITRQKLNSLPKISDFLSIRQGVVTGVDEIFIRRADQVPSKEKAIYAPLLRDRDMLPYNTPSSTESFVFYPFIENRKVTSDELEKKFPKTWAYLTTHRERLERRGSLERYKKQWWEPMWPRSPDKLLVSKIVSPHLMIVPRFSWDVEGVFAVSRSSFLAPLTSVEGAEHDLLRYFLAVLNSSTAFWYLSSNSHVYRGGYLMLESKNLSELRVPDPTKIESNILLELLNLVDRRLEATSNQALMIEREIDNIVSTLYGLTPKEKKNIGLY